MRALCFVLFVGGAMACGDQGPCGVDADGNLIAACEVDGAPYDGAYCPGEHWGVDDGCNSCGCGPNGGAPICTQNVCQ